MRVLTTMIAVGGEILKTDTIEHEGRFWLVPAWLDHLEERYSTPARIICLDSLPHQKGAGDLADFVINSPIPKYVLEGRVPPEEASRYEIVERPDIRFPFGNA